MPRGFRITQSLLDKFDYSKGCPKCEALRRGDVEYTGHYSTECRKRIQELMREDPELSKKLKEVEDKQHRWIGRRIEAHDARDTTRPQQAPEASAPETAMPLEHALEQLLVGPMMGPSGQGGEEPFDATKAVEQIEKFQQKIDALERSLERSIEALKESKEKLK